MAHTISSVISYSRPSAAKTGVLGLLNTWLSRIQERRTLSNLEPHMLKDIGLEGWQISEQIEKPFWRA